VNILRFLTPTQELLRGNLFYVRSCGVGHSTAFEINEKAQIRILLPRLLGVVSVNAEILDESFSRVIDNIKAEWQGIISGKDEYAFSIDTSRLGVGLYFFRLSIDCALGSYYGFKRKRELVLTTDNRGEHFQLSICSFKHKAPEDKLGGVIYHIFVDRFNRGGRVQRKKGAILVERWNQIPEYPQYPGAPLKNNCFYGGTIWGIIEKLDYIASLGVNIIYLSPIFDAASNHKYDTADYMTVDKMFGGKAALRALIKDAHSRGIAIILDGVFNHTGSDSIYFNREGNYKSVGAYQSRESEYFPWYDFQSYPDKYTCWWGIDILPRINTRNPDVCQFIAGDGGVVDHYSSMGIDGFRLDVVDELPDDLVAKIKNKLSSNNPNSILYGEVWEDGSNKIAYDERKRYYLGEELDGVMNYPIRRGIIEYLRSGAIDSLYYALTDVTDNAPDRIRNMQMNLLGTHDTERILTLLGGESAQGHTNSYLATKRMNDIERGIAKRKLRMAYTILATLPGIPTIFYGDEAGLEGYSDPFNRMPYPWGKEDLVLINHYRALGEIRKSNSVYKDGSFELYHLDGRTLIFSRKKDALSYITIVNNSKFERTIEFSLVAKALINKRKGCSFSLPAFTAEVFAVNDGCILDISN